MSHQDIVFYTVLGFFVLIGLASVAVIFGLFRPQKDVRQWALRGFAASTTSVIFAAFRMLDPSSAAEKTPPPPPPIHVALTLPAELNTSFKLSRYEYIESGNGGKISVHKGDVTPVLNPGGWEVVLPGEAADKPTALHFLDANGSWWETATFTPNYTTQKVASGHVFTELRNDSWHTPGVVVLAAAEAGLPAAQSAPGATVKFANFARRIEDRYGRAYYEWRVFIDEPASVLATIDQVDYLLHPTFPQPFQTTTDRSNKFQLDGSGWGGFNVVATVHYKNGTQSKMSYFLDLTKNWPATSDAQLKLETIQVMEDGSVGATSWSFDVLVDGKVALRVPSKSYEDDKSGQKGTQYPADPSRSVVSVKVPAGKTARLEVRGKRTNAADTATGTAVVPSNSGRVTVAVTNTNPRKGSFVFYFVAG